MKKVFLFSSCMMLLTGCVIAPDEGRIYRPQATAYYGPVYRDYSVVNRGFYGQSIYRKNIHSMQRPLPMRHGYRNRRPISSKFNQSYQQQGYSRDQYTPRRPTTLLKKESSGRPQRQQQYQYSHQQRNQFN
ncbi:hypothetical protein B9T31_03370 [Acinetobacter sp. ANC 4558]|nr:hypothetical protein B9T31_03370 [Acinetobacter sp. ANC 4558]